MALIGTISGSNGTSTTAISGSLVIADAPASKFPRLSGNVKFLVSGSKNADRTDNAEFVFNVDVFHSGAIGSDQFMQFKPVGTLQIPSNTTASYIYTSGSTNDLYFTQYNGPYTNTTRLRWLEAALGTGLLSGGTLTSTSGSTTYNIASGSGLIVEYNAHSLVSPVDQVEPYPVITRVQWPNLTAQALPSLSTTQITYVGIDSTGSPYLKSTPFIDGDFDNYISLGRILHTDKLGTNGAVSQPTVSYGQTHFRGDFVRAFGPIKLSGHTFYANGTQGLAKDAGDSYAEGRNYTADPDSPNYVKSTTDTAQPTSKIFYQYVNGSGEDVILNNGNLGYSVLDCNRYINAGSPATVGSGNKFTIQRVFWFPNAVNRAFYVYYGTVIYSTIADAQAGIATEVFTEGKNTRDGAIFLGYVIVKGVSLDFTDPTTYKIIQAGSFRAVASSGAGATGTPGGSDTHVQFNDAAVFNGTSDFRFVKGTGTALVAKLVVSGTSAGSLVSSGTLQVKSGTGDVVGYISSSGEISGSGNIITGGNVTGSNALFSGDLAVNGGDITSSAASLNISAGSSGLAFQQSGTTFATFISGASGPLQQAVLQAGASKNLVLAGGTGRQVVLSGSSIELRAAISGAPSGIDFSTEVGGLAQAYLNVTTGSYTTVGSTSTNISKVVPGDLPQPHDLLIGASVNRTLYLSGSSIVSNAGNSGFFFQRDGSSYGVIQGVSGSSFTIGSAAGVISMNLVSSGNVTVKLDSDNNALGHKFVIQDWNNIEQFSVGENGNAEISGSLVVTGSTTIGSVVENLINSNGSTGTTTFNLNLQGIFYVNAPAGDITANFTNVPTTNLRVITPTVILSQSATPRIVSAVQIDTAVQTINWANGTTPTGTAGKQDVFGFSLIRSGSAWKVLGQMSTYG
jgi:hypothetical protein